MVQFISFNNLSFIGEKKGLTGLSTIQHSELNDIFQADPDGGSTPAPRLGEGGGDVRDPV